MASVTTRPPDGPDLARVAPETVALPLTSVLATVRIEPPRGWLELRLAEVWLGIRNEDKFTFVSAEGNVASMQRIPSDRLPMVCLLLNLYSLSF
jgi:hypothetical protein